MGVLIQIYIPIFENLSELENDKFEFPHCLPIWTNTFSAGHGS